MTEIHYVIDQIWELFIDNRDATIIDFVWGIITVSRLLRLLCIYSFHNIKWHKQSLDIQVLFIAAFWNRNNTLTNNTAQNNNTKEKKVSPIGIEKGDLCSVNIHDSISLLQITNGNRFISGIFILYLRYRTWKDGKKKMYMYNFRVAFYCVQPKAHLCNNHAVLSASWYATPVRWMDYLGKGEVLTNTDLDRFVNNIWEK